MPDIPVTSSQNSPIEGQIHVIKEFAAKNGYTIVSSYIDRAK